MFSKAKRFDYGRASPEVKNVCKKNRNYISEDAPGKRTMSATKSSSKKRTKYAKHSGVYLSLEPPSSAIRRGFRFKTPGPESVTKRSNISSVKSAVPTALSTAKCSRKISRRSLYTAQKAKRTPLRRLTVQKLLKSNAKVTKQPVPAEISGVAEVNSNNVPEKNVILLLQEKENQILFLREKCQNLIKLNEDVVSFNTSRMKEMQHLFEVFDNRCRIQEADLANTFGLCLAHLKKNSEILGKFRVIGNIIRYIEDNSLSGSKNNLVVTVRDQLQQTDDTELNEEKIPDQFFNGITKEVKEMWDKLLVSVSNLHQLIVENQKMYKSKLNAKNELIASISNELNTCKVRLMEMEDEKIILKLKNENLERMVKDPGLLKQLNEFCKQNDAPPLRQKNLTLPSDIKELQVKYTGFLLTLQEYIEDISNSFPNTFLRLEDANKSAVLINSDIAVAGSSSDQTKVDTKGADEAKTTDSAAYGSDETVAATATDKGAIDANLHIHATSGSGSDSNSKPWFLRESFTSQATNLTEVPSQVINRLEKEVCTSQSEVRYWDNVIVPVNGDDKENVSPLMLNELKEGFESKEKSDSSSSEETRHGCSSTEKKSRRYARRVLSSISPDHVP